MEPRFIEAKFASTCPETGLAIKKGDTVAYYPKERKAYHASSKAAEVVRAADFAKAWKMGDADW